MKVHCEVFHNTHIIPQNHLHVKSRLDMSPFVDIFVSGFEA